MRFLDEAGPAGDADACIAAADALLAAGDQELAASALDRAYGLRPDDAVLAARRAALLDALAVESCGLRFRYIPAGSFLMGSEDGDPDEQPVHRRRLEAFWMSEAPLTWVDFCRVMDWSPPPEGEPKEAMGQNQQFRVHLGNRVRRQYCLSGTFAWNRLGEATAEEYDTRPMIMVSSQLAKACAARLPGGFLPTEAQWEKAARGGLIGARYAWGMGPPDPERCDFGRFDDFSVADPRGFPPNGYGLYAMCGGVWEWTADRYDAEAYRNRTIDSRAEEQVLRGGSWADCASAVTVSFRMSTNIGSTPTVGLRLAARFTEPR